MQARRLISHFGSARAVFERDLQAEGVRLSPKAREGLRQPRYRDRARKEWAFVHAKGIRCLPFTHPEYPQLLLQCADFPILLYTLGEMDLNPTGPAIAMVGTRRMTAYGGQMCRRLVGDLAGNDPLIISGYAYGVDICAQREAARLGLQTVACLAHGLDRIYPPEHDRFKAELMSRGGFVTEFPSGTPPEPGFFLRRNRIIAGMAQATIVVESPEKGGSLVTADLAFGYDRQVFAVPGRLTDPNSAGCHKLIREQKAELLQQAADLGPALPWHAPEGPLAPAALPPPEELGETALSVWGFLEGDGARLLDDIAVGCGIPVSAAALALFQLEMGDYIRPLPGKRYARKG